MCVLVLARVYVCVCLRACVCLYVRVVFAVCFGCACLCAWFVSVLYILSVSLHW